MSTTTTFKKGKVSFTVFLLFISTIVLGQVSPYGLSPEWYFGKRWGISFANGNFPSGGAATPVLRPASMNVNNETSTSVSYTSGAIALYSNSILAFNSAGTTIRNFDAAWTGGDNTCGGSSSGGVIAFPNPAALDNQFYLFMGNDQTGGTCTNKSNTSYVFQTTAGVTQYLSGPSGPLIPPTYASQAEAIVVGTDGVGGYWLVTHTKNNTNTYNIMHFLANGTVTGPTSLTWGRTIDDNGGLSALKFSPCQDKIAYAAGGKIDVYVWNRATGTPGAMIRQISGAPGNTSIEFSADGNQIYYSSGVSASDITRYDLVAGTATAMGTTESWTMMLGPDGNIYNTNTTNVKVITANNTASPVNSVVATPGTASLYQGLINVAWLSPRTPDLTATQLAACTDVRFDFSFVNYFGTNITIKATGATIDFGDGSPVVNNPTFPLTHTFPTAGGPYNVVYSFNDQYCNQSWSDNVSVPINCPAPVTWFDVDATPHNGVVDVYWATSMEENTSHFIVQRSSDGIHFEDLTSVPAAGNSNNIREYGFVDVRPYSGTSYYRIVQYDNDGKHSNSRVVTVSIGSVYMNVYPNPSSGAFNVELSGADVAVFTITDPLGRVVYRQSFTGESIKTQVGEDLPDGTYVLTIDTNDKSYHHKLVKQ